MFLPCGYYRERWSRCVRHMCAPYMYDIHTNTHKYLFHFGDATWTYICSQLCMCILSAQPLISCQRFCMFRIIDIITHFSTGYYAHMNTVHLCLPHLHTPTIHVCVFVCVRACMYIYIYIIHTHTHIYIHMHISPHTITIRAYVCAVHGICRGLVIGRKTGVPQVPYILGIIIHEYHLSWSYILI
jgi:hypothetical protein